MGFFDNWESTVPDRTTGEAAKDFGVSFKQGLTTTGSDLVGLIDLATPGDLRGWLHDTIGYSPDTMVQKYQEQKSPYQQNEEAMASQGKGFTGTIKSYLKHPTAIGNQAVQMAPFMAAAGALGRGALALAPEMGVPTAAGLGEGLATIGDQEAQAYYEGGGQTSLAQKELSLLSGGITGVIGGTGGRLMQKMGFNDPDLFFTAGLPAMAKKIGGTPAKSIAEVAKRIAGSGIGEAFEEIPQTGQETMFMNAALGKPVFQGVPEAMGQAGITAAATGGAAGIVHAPAIEAKHEFDTGVDLTNKEDEYGFKKVEDVLKGSALKDSALAKLKEMQDVSLPEPYKMPDITEPVIKPEPTGPIYDLATPQQQDDIIGSMVDAQYQEDIKVNNRRPKALPAGQGFELVPGEEAGNRLYNQYQPEVPVEQTQKEQQAGQTQTPTEKSSQEKINADQTGTNADKQGETTLPTEKPLPETDIPRRTEGKEAEANTRGRVENIKGLDLRYDGKQEGFGPVAASHQITIMSGPAEGTTLSVPDVEENTIRAAVKAKETQYSKSGNASTPAGPSSPGGEVSPNTEKEWYNAVKKVYDKTLKALADQVNNNTDETLEAYFVAKEEHHAIIKEYNKWKERNKLPWKNSDLATSPNIPLSKIKAEQQPTGRYKLFYRGTKNEVFQGKEFNSAPKARLFFLLQRAEAQKAVSPSVKTAPNDKAPVIIQRKDGTPYKTERSLRIQAKRKGIADFDEKPPSELRKTLKHFGFRWAPSVGVWQKLRKPNAFDEAVYIADKIEKDAGLFSKSSQPTGSTVAQVKQEVRKALTPRGYRRLIDKGLIRIVQSISSLPENIKRMVAWHGSPHAFSEFNIEHVGTGEGAQAYGYGMYFAGDKEVAEYYKKVLGDGVVKVLDKNGVDLTSENSILTPNAKKILADGILMFPENRNVDYLVNRIENNKMAAERWIKQGDNVKSNKQYVRAADELLNKLAKGAKIQRKKGRLYKVNLAPKENEYLSWDNTVPKETKKHIEANLKDYRKTFEKKRRAYFLENESKYNWEGDKVDYPAMVEKFMVEELARFDRATADILDGFGDNSGKALYKNLSRLLKSDKAASEFLHSIGIRGIKYLDGSSRGRGEGNYNYVIFNDTDVEIQAIYSKDGNHIAGYYDPATNQITLIADNIDPSNVEGVLLHEIAHKLLATDEQFIKDKAALLDRFEALESEAVKKAFERARKAEVNGSPELIREEALAYYLEANHKTPIFHRLVAIIKDALRRLGFRGIDKMTGDDFVQMFKRGLRSDTDATTTNRSEPRYSIADTVKEKIAHPISGNELFNKFMQYIVDKNRSIAQIQKRLGGVSEDLDLFMKETQRPKISAYLTRKFWNEQVQPFIEEAAKNKIEIGQVEELAHALHAPEANEALRNAKAKSYLDDIVNSKLNKELEDKLTDEIFKAEEELDNLPFDYRVILEKFLKQHGGEVETIRDSWERFSEKPSGMTDQEADDITRKHVNNREIHALVDRISAINEGKLDILHDAGLITDAEYNAYKNKYEHYVPLYREGFEGEAASGIGAGLQAPGKPIKTRGGSSRRVVDIFANTVKNYETALIRAEKSKSMETLYNLVKNNPDPDLWHIKEEKKAPYYDSWGNLREYTTQALNKNEIRIKINGKPYIIEMSRDNPTAMRMMETLKAEYPAHGPIVNFLAKINRFLAAVNTSYAPEFILSNFFRDLPTGLINISESNLSSYEMFKKVKQSMQTIARVEMGKNVSKEEATLYERYNAAGGKISWSDVHKTAQDLAETIQAEYEYASGNRPIRSAIRKWDNLWEDLNIAVENSGRFAAFKLGVENGMSDTKAAQMASDLTVDFTKKGTMSPVLNSLYIFFNASVQGNYRIARALINSPKARKIVGGLAMMGFMAGLWNAAAGGDDLDDYLKERNLVLKIPESKKMVKIPLPYGFNFFVNAGYEMADMVTNKGYSPIHGAARMATVLAGSFNPIQAGTLLQTFAPTVLDPIAQVGENKTWFGGTLMPEKDKYAKVQKPDSQRYWKSVSAPSKWLASSMNSITGGNKVKPGLVDVSPETLDLIMDTMGGSAFRFVKDLALMPGRALNNELPMYKIPFVRRVMSEAPEYATSKKYYRLREDLLTREAESNVYPDKFQLDGEDKRLLRVLKRTERKISKLRKKMRLTQDKATQDALKGMVDTLQKLVVESAG